MVTLKNEFGFSFASILLTITLIFITLPFAAYLLDNLTYSSQQEAISVQQFVFYLRDELIQSESYKMNKSSISYKINDEEIGKISKYGDLIRRQVNNKGHEIYLRDIKDFSLESSTYGIHVVITTLSGEKYEETIILSN